MCPLHLFPYIDVVSEEKQSRVFHQLQIANVTLHFCIYDVKNTILYASFRLD